MAIECWASSRGDCCGVQSQEHYVSAGLFAGATVTVSGFGWCKEPKTIPVARATSGLLCERHNNQLHIVDAAGARSFATLREITRIHGLRTKIKKPKIWNVLKRRIDAASLERWFLKTTVNLVAMTGELLNWGNSPAAFPPPGIVDTVYGDAPILPPQGAYFAVGTTQKVPIGDDFGFAPLFQRTASRVVGALIEFRGLHVVLWLTDESPPARLTGPLPGRLTEGWSGAELQFRTPMIGYKNGPYLSQRLILDWAK
jgi:hypothetical protein